MGNISRALFSQKYLDTSTPSLVKAIFFLTVDMNQSLSFEWKAHVVVLYLHRVYRAPLQMARGTSSGGSNWCDED